MTSVVKVAEIFQYASAAFSRLAQLTLDLKMSQEQPCEPEVKSSGKWSHLEIDQLKDAIQRFGNDLTKIAEVIESKSLSQIKQKIRSKVFQDAGYAVPISSAPIQLGGSNIVIQSAPRGADIMGNQLANLGRLQRKHPLEEGSGQSTFPNPKRGRYQTNVDADALGNVDTTSSLQIAPQQQQQIVILRDNAEAVEAPIATTVSTTSSMAATSLISTTIRNSGTISSGGGNILVRGITTHSNTGIISTDNSVVLTPTISYESMKRITSLPVSTASGSPAQRVVRITSSAPSEGSSQASALSTSTKLVSKLLSAKVQIVPKITQSKRKLPQPKTSSYTNSGDGDQGDEYADYDDDDEDGDDDDDDDVVARYDDEDDFYEDEEEDDDEDDDGILDAGQRDDDEDDEDYIVGRG